MIKEYFADNLSIEDLAEMTDKMLRFEKNQKSGGLKINLLKIIPAAAMVALFIGIISILPMFQGIAGAGSETENKFGEPEAEMQMAAVDATNEVADLPGNSFLESFEVLDILETDDKLLTYDEYKEYVENVIIPDLQALLGTEMTQEEIDGQIAFYQDNLERVKNGITKVWFHYYKGTDKLFCMSSSTIPGYSTGLTVLYEDNFDGTYSLSFDDGVTWENYSYDQVTELIDSMGENGTPCFTFENKYRTFMYRYVSDDGESQGFAAFSYKELYKLVKDFFGGQIQAGKMTREEADGKLAELPGAHRVIK